jgi:putative transposase
MQVESIVSGAADPHRAVLQIAVQRPHNIKAVERLLRKPLKKQTRAPQIMITDKLAGYPDAKRGFHTAKAFAPKEG